MGLRRILSASLETRVLVIDGEGDYTARLDTPLRRDGWTASAGRKPLEMRDSTAGAAEDAAKMGQLMEVAARMDDRSKDTQEILVMMRSIAPVAELDLPHEA